MRTTADLPGRPKAARRDDGLPIARARSAPAFRFVTLSLGLACLLGVGAWSAAARTIRVEFSFDAPVLRTSDDGRVIVEVPGCATFAEPGLPLLPAQKAVILVPPGETVQDVRVLSSPEQILDGTYRVAAAQRPQPISRPGPFPVTEPDPAVYGSDAAYPSEAAHLVAQQIAWGHRLAFFRLCPVTYRPLSGQLAWHDRMTLQVETAPIAGADPSRVPNLRRSEVALSRLASVLSNPADLELYASAVPAHGEACRLTPDNYPYVIITTPDLAPGYAELARHESSRGLRARVVPLDEITGSYPGIDTPEMMRNFIIDAYQNWQTEYVLLGGDSDVVPVRNLYCDAGGTIDQFPGDCYFEGLDGDWNGDGDELWGEPDEYDLIGEIAVGRVTARNLTELNNWIHKDEMYAEHPVVSEVQKALFLGERMDDVPTWGGDYMDRVKDYTCDWGYCTSGYPNFYLKQTLYDREGYSWSAAEAIALFNSGFPTSHHLGHANVDYSMKMVNSDIQYFTNDGVTHSYLFISTQGCDSNAFDANWSDSFSEVFLRDDNGAAAFLGNTRYGWYCPGYSTGPSQHYDRQFVDARYGEGIGTIGWMNVDSKVDNIWQMDPWNLWCHYELCILGDPAMPQWNRIMGELALNHTGHYVMGQGDYEVRVLSGGLPVEGATVSIVSDDLDACVSGVTNAQGVVRLNPNPVDPATLRVKAIRKDYLPASGDVLVDPGSQPWLEWDSTQLDDDAIAPSVGDGDGMADMGETIQLLVRLRNIGHETAHNVTVALACEDPRITMLDPTAGYGSIEGQASAVNLDDLIIQVTNNIQDGDVIHFSVQITSDDRRQWDDGFDITLHAAVLSMVSWAIDDSQSGDGQGDIDPGEEFQIHIVLSNSGSEAGHDLVAELADDAELLTMQVDESGDPLLPPGGAEELTPPFLAVLDRTMPTESFIHFSLRVTTWCQQVYETGFDVRVASYFEDLLERESGWTVGSPDDDATQGIWVRVDPVGTYRVGVPVQPEDDHTPEGADCFVTGQAPPGGPANYSDVDRGKTTLTSPAIDLRWAVEPHLVYWRWYTNNLGQYPGQDYWQVDVSDDGGVTWVHLEYTNQSANQWSRMEFNLGDYIEQTQNVKIRFIASDYGYDSLVEAAVDDISIESLPRNLNGVEDPERSPAVFGIHRVLPNPAGPGSLGGGEASRIRIDYALASPGPVTLQLFDVRGGLIRTLVQAKQEAGEYRIDWDGRSQTDRPVPAGMYFCRLQSAGREAVRKVVLLTTGSGRN